MKRIICILAAAALFGNVSILACRAANKTIEVSTTQEFLDAIGNNRTIVIKEGLDITSTLLESQNSKLRVSYEQIKTTNKKVFFVDEFDGPELHIANVKNLSIVAGDDIIVLMSDPRYADVISFERCTNLTIKGITFGHSEEGYCDNGVLGFTDCSHIVLDRVDMFGCGTEGIEVDQCTDVQFKASKIRDCSYHIMHLRNSSYITFEGCQFFRNREFEQVNIYECSNVLFDNCMFANNTGELFNVHFVQSKVEFALSVFADKDSEIGGSDIESRTIQFGRVLYYLQGHWWTGRGYDFFWIDLQFSEGQQYSLDPELLGLEGVHLKYLLERGILGYAMYLIFYLLLLSYIWRHRKSNREEAAGALSLLVLYLSFAHMTGELKSVPPTLLMLGMFLRLIQNESWKWVQYQQKKFDAQFRNRYRQLS